VGVAVEHAEVQREHEQDEEDERGPDPEHPSSVRVQGSIDK
jgi:hypothetical protein